MALNFSQSQKQSQKQIQKLSQVQIQSLNYLSMSSTDLRTEIFDQVEKNPALEILNDNSETGEFSEKNNFENLSDYNFSYKDRYSAEERTQAFSDILESNPDTRESLSEHLLFQFNLIELSENQKILGQKLINNLDKNGFHILAPVSFLNYETDTDEDLQKCICLIQNLEPVGCCCKNVTESLFVQAKAISNAPEAALFILDDHLEFLDPPVASKVLKKICDFAKEESKKEFSTKDFSFALKFTEEQIQQAINFIQTLDPHPASQYSQDENSYVIPDVKVEKIPLVTSELEFEPNIILAEQNSTNKKIEHSFVVNLQNSILPDVQISTEYKKLLALEKNEKLKISAEQKEKLNATLKEAKTFIESLLYRKNSVFNAALAIVKIQIEFFEKGPGHLVPLKQKDVAEILGVHETTVSRIANSKTLECEWGVFPFKYFFVSGTCAAVDSCAMSEDFEEGKMQEVSKDKIIFEIKNILDSLPQGSKTLSDQKISDLLLQKGIKVARRTVAKYRQQIGLRSSYER